MRFPVWGPDTIFAVRPRYVLALVAVSGIALAAAVVAVVRAKHAADTGDAGVVTAPAGPRFDGAVLASGLRAPRVVLRDQDGRRTATAGERGRAWCFSRSLVAGHYPRQDSNLRPAD